LPWPFPKGWLICKGKGILKMNTLSFARMEEGDIIIIGRREQRARGRGRSLLRSLS